MASALPTLCLDEIFKNLRNDLSSLHASALVNRHWWRHAIAQLWRDPFVIVKSKTHRAKLFYSLLLCLDDTVEKTLHEPYLTYIKKFNFAELVKMGKGEDKIDLKSIQALSHAIINHGNLRELDNDLTA